MGRFEGYHRWRGRGNWEIFSLAGLGLLSICPTFSLAAPSNRAFYQPQGWTGIVTDSFGNEFSYQGPDPTQLIIDVEQQGGETSLLLFALGAFPNSGYSIRNVQVEQEARLVKLNTYVNASSANSTPLVSNLYHEERLQLAAGNYELEARYFVNDQLLCEQQTTFNIVPESCGAAFFLAMFLLTGRRRN